MTAEFNLRKVRSPDDADDCAFKLHLFRDETGTPCGWYIGPLVVTAEGIEMPYLPPSTRTRAAVAIVRAIEASRVARRELCLVDPHDLWEPVWSVAR